MKNIFRKKTRLAPTRAGLLKTLNVLILISLQLNESFSALSGPRRVKTTVAAPVTAPAPARATARAIGVETPCWAYQDIYTNDVLKQIVTQSEGRPIVMIASGWSESALSNMRKHDNEEKQVRGFAPNYSLALKIKSLGGNPKMIYLATERVWEMYRKYLFTTLTGKGDDRLFNDFEKSAYFTHIFEPKDPKKDTGKEADDDAAETSKNALDLEVNKKVIEALKAQVAELRSQGALFLGLQAHFTGPKIKKLADTLGVPLLGNPEFDTAFAKKSECRLTYQEEGILHAPGSAQPRFTTQDLVDDTYKVLKEHGPQKIMVKIERSSAGNGNKTLDEFIKYDAASLKNPRFETYYKKEIEKVLQQKFDADPKYYARIGRHGAMIEMFIRGHKSKVDGVDTFSPAVLAVVAPPSSSKTYYTYYQQFADTPQAQASGDPGQDYAGAIGPFDGLRKTFDQIQLYSGKILANLARKGFRGPIGIDFLVVTPFGETQEVVYAIENNPRQTGTLGPVRTASMALLDESPLFNGTLSLYSKDDLALPNHSKDFLSAFYRWFVQQSDLNFHAGRGTGMIVHLPFQRSGKIGVVSLAPRKIDAINQMRSFKSRLDTFAESRYAVGRALEDKKIPPLVLGVFAARATRLELLEEAHKKGVQSYVFTLESKIDWANKQISDVYVVNPGNGRWELVTGPVPMPEVVFDYGFFSNRGSEVLAKAEKLRSDLAAAQIPFINPDPELYPLLNKQSFSEVIRRAESSVGPIAHPETYQDDALGKNLKGMLSKHPIVYLKPTFGNQGKGIITISQDPSYMYSPSAGSPAHATTFLKSVGGPSAQGSEKLSATVRYKTQNADGSWVINQKVVATAAELAAVINDAKTEMDSRRAPYVIQQGIPSFSYKGRQTFLRAMVQRREASTTSNPELTAVAAGIGGNHAQGGASDNPEIVYRSIAHQFACRVGAPGSPAYNQYVDQVVSKIKSDMTQLAITTFRAVEQSAGKSVAELGLDIVLDQNGKPYVVEANTKSGRVYGYSRQEYKDAKTSSRQLFEDPSFEKTALRAERAREEAIVDYANSLKCQRYLAANPGVTVTVPACQSTRKSHSKHQHGAP